MIRTRLHSCCFFFKHHYFRPNHFQRCCMYVIGAANIYIIYSSKNINVDLMQSRQKDRMQWSLT